MLILLVRVAILYLVVVLSMRLMGKRQIGQLEPSELVTAILISEFAAASLDDPGKPLLTSVVPILMLLSCELILSYSYLKSRLIKRIFCGTDCIVVKDGKILESQLKKQRVTVDELFEELRIKNFADVGEIKYAIYEPGGQLSVFPYPAYAPAAKGDLNADCEDKGIHFIVIADGRINKNGLREISKDRAWVDDTLRQNNIASVKDVYFLSANLKGDIILNKRVEKV